MYLQLVGRSYLSAIGHLLDPTTIIIRQSEEIEVLHDGNRASSSSTIINGLPTVRVSTDTRTVESESAIHANSVEIERKSATIEIEIEEHSEEWVYGD